MKYSDKILKFATKAHEGQLRKFTSNPYITHPIAVAEIAVRMCTEKHDTEIVQSVAYLHDVIEDTNVTIDQLSVFLSTLELGILNHVIICDAVNKLTKKEPFDIIPYLDSIKDSPIARIVKLADLEHNMSDLKPSNLLDKYKLCQHFLKL